MIPSAMRRKRGSLQSGAAAFGGACCILAGWGLVLYEPVIYPLAQTAAGADLPAPGYYIPVIGQNAIITGFGLALFGAAHRIAHLLTGLGASLVQRRGEDRAGGSKQVRAGAAAPNGTIAPGPNWREARRDIIARGALNGRGYILFRDGSVMVETLLGPKRFASMTDAQNFVAAN